MHTERSLVPAVCRFSFACLILVATSVPVSADIVSAEPPPLIDLRSEGTELLATDAPTAREVTSRSKSTDSPTFRIPEPSSMVLLGLAGGASLAARAIRRARQRTKPAMLPE